MLKRRRSQAPAKQQTLSQKAVEALMRLPAYDGARRVALYVSMPGEVQTDRLLQGALQAGKCVCVPAWCRATRRYAFAALHPGDRLTPGPMDVLQPRTPVWVSAAIIDAVVTPGVSFGTLGGRVGFGGGHYDRMLARCHDRCLRIGLAFDWQLQPRVPMEAHDAVMNWIVTDKRTLACDVGAYGSERE